MNLNNLKNVFKKNKKLYSLYYSAIGSKREARTIEKRKQEMKSEGLRWIKKINSSLNKLNFIYFIDFGTLLGCVRDHSFIAWDYDIDFGIVVNESFSWDKLEKALNDIGLFKCKEFVYDGNITEQTFTNGILTIDFFGHFNNIEGSKCNFYSFGGDYDHPNLYFATEMTSPVIDSTVDGRLYDLDVKIPYNYENYLESVYTTSWRIPDPKWGGDKVLLPNRKKLPHYGYMKQFKR